MAEAGSPSILAASQDGAYLLRLQGDVRLSWCTTIEDYLDGMFADPQFASVWVDVCQADGIDSTTLGLLASLALRAREEFGLTPVMYSCRPGITRLLKSMTFQQIFELREEACSSVADAEPLPVVQGSEAAVKSSVMAAHETLMGLSETNRERFRDLMTVLEKG